MDPHKNRIGNCESCLKMRFLVQIPEKCENANSNAKSFKNAKKNASISGKGLAQKQQQFSPKCQKLAFPQKRIRQSGGSALKKSATRKSRFPPKRRFRFHRCYGNGGSGSSALAETPKFVSVWPGPNTLVEYRNHTSYFYHRRWMKKHAQDNFHIPRCKTLRLRGWHNCNYVIWAD